MAGTNRRKVIIGAAALGLTGISPVEAAGDTELLALGSDVARLSRRCQRLARQARRARDDTAAWARWSAAVDERSNLLHRIARTPARSTAGLAIKMQAVVWELLDDDLIMDEVARKRLAALSRDLGRLVLK